MSENLKRCCDTCKYYHWYYDKCDKYNCEVDARSVCVAYENSRNNKQEKDVLLGKD